jgi:hypothetical protein
LSDVDLFLEFPPPRFNTIEDCVAHFRAQLPIVEANETSIVEANETSIVEANETSIVEANETSIVEANETSIVEPNIAATNQPPKSIPSKRKADEGFGKFKIIPWNERIDTSIISLSGIPGDMCGLNGPSGHNESFANLVNIASELQQFMAGDKVMRSFIRSLGLPCLMLKGSLIERFALWRKLTAGKKSRAFQIFREDTAPHQAQLSSFMCEMRQLRAGARNSTRDIILQFETFLSKTSIE